MAFREIRPKLQLTFDEFVQTWRVLILEYYARALDPGLTDGELGLKEEGMLRYSLELSAILMSIALRAWNARKQVAEQVRRQVADAVVDSFYEKLFDAEYQENRAEYIAYFKSKYERFLQICPNLAGKDEKKRRAELIGLARYLAAQASDKPEEENAKAIEQLGVVFLSAAPVFLAMANNSAPDIGTIGKPKFIVQK